MRATRVFRDALPKGLPTLPGLRLTIVWDMNGLGEATRKAFEKVLDKACAERRQLDAWECECLRAALVMMAMNDNVSAQFAIEGSERAPPGVDVNLQPTSTIEDMRACLAMLVAH